MDSRVLGWLKGLAAGVISGGAGGIITGFAVMGFDPQHFNLESGMKHTLAMAGISAILHAVLGAAMYLQQSPLPADPKAQQ